MTVENLFYFLEENLENGLIDNETSISLNEKALTSIKLIDGTIYLECEE